MRSVTAFGPPCWGCESTATALLRSGVDVATLQSSQFRITDSGYGITADIYRCADCGLRFCPDMTDVLSRYVEMDDPEYESTRAQRLVQARKLLKPFASMTPGTRLLDVGAGSGILVEAALDMGFEATGVEPSRSLAAIARSHDLPVETGVLGDLPEDTFQLIFLVDVLEHVSSPHELLCEIVSRMDERARCVVVIPDAGSFLARLLGRYWWHYRIAHVSYFDRHSAEILLRRSGLAVEGVSRPGWCLPAGYLFERVCSYLPRPLQLRAPAFLHRINVPLNLRDSLMLVCRRHQPVQLD